MGGFADFNEPCYKQSLPFQKVEHKVATLDAQPSNEAGGILVMVTGALLVRTLLFQIRTLGARFANLELLSRYLRSMRSNNP